MISRLKKVTAIFLAASMIFALAACGGDKSGGSKSSKEAMAGNYPVVGAIIDGEELSYADLVAIDAVDGTYLKINDDGTGEISLSGEDTCKIKSINKEKGIFVFDDGVEASYTKDGDKITADIESVGLVLIFALEGSQTYKDITSETTGAGAFSGETAAALGGDWLGIAEFYDCTGIYADNEDLQIEILARFVFDESGNCKPYIALAMSDDDLNFNNLVLTPVLGNDYEVDLWGDLMGVEMDGISFIDIENDGSISIYAGVDETEEDGFELMASLRRIDDQDNWSDNNYPRMPQEYIDFYSGMSLEEIAQFCELDTSKIPEF